ncbi:TRAP transporter small permease subunit [Corticibacter populi]|uniref:TRAP transporter small permease protein n=1 Tax=Corticibacter populi TaxID=1550736 RepID=A0A3M6QTX9_9BURK|nr:TRAP transporter small permease subunit [Corticibacter populi]RMX06488.1 TRAP transporter small permease subunit [Corticibacter populi]RZS31953.1 TRAP-type C4-dicarboxylate transport system permease small subunit [Corticibacter populi]
MRKFLDGLYAASGWLAGLSMIGVLLMVLLTIFSRFFGFAAPGTDAYAGYAMAGAGFLALASTLKKGEHIRVTLVLGMLGGKARKVLELAALLVAVLLSGFLAFYSARLVWQSWEYHDISVGIDATPLWIPQIVMAVGTLIFFIAFVDEFILEILGRRQAAPTGEEEPHHE